MLRSRVGKAQLATRTWTACPTLSTGAVRRMATLVDGPVTGHGVKKHNVQRQQSIGGESPKPLIRRVLFGLSPALEKKALAKKAKRMPDPYNVTKDKQKHNGHGQSCAILTSTPQSTSLAHLLAQIPPLNPDHVPFDFACFTFLLTPAYASEARHAKHLFQETIKRLYPHAQSGTGGIHSLVAVVDSIPQPLPAPQDGGAEGVAFVFHDLEGAVPDLVNTSEHVASPRPIRDIASSLQTRRSLTFHISHPPIYNRPKDGARSARKRAAISYSAQIPLAKTIFQNGLDTTLIHSHYNLVRTTYTSQSSPAELHEVEERHLDHQSMHVPPNKGSVSMHVPLLPLTPARSVVACMGNIVRRLAATPYDYASTAPSEQAEDDTILASQELEQSVQAYFKARNMAPEAVSVWALVLPKNSRIAQVDDMTDVLRPANLESRWTKNNLGPWFEPRTCTPLSLLENDARLHKVISGGGGWGKKAGLLSLDPDSSYSADESSSQQSAFFAGLNLDGADEASALRDIVSPGDLIQFYISPTATATPRVKQDEAPHPAEGRSAVFGTIPSTIDTMPHANATKADEASPTRLHLGHFGAFSEVGMALTVNVHQNGTVKPLNKTKFDVPYSTINFQSYSKTIKRVRTAPTIDPTSRPETSKREQAAIHKGRAEAEAASSLAIHPTQPLESTHAVSPNDAPDADAEAAASSNPSDRKEDTVASFYSDPKLRSALASHIPPEDAEAEAKTHDGTPLLSSEAAGAEAGGLTRNQIVRLRRKFWRRKVWELKQSSACEGDTLLKGESAGRSIPNQVASQDADTSSADEDVSPLHRLDSASTFQEPSGQQLRSTAPRSGEVPTDTHSSILRRGNTDPEEQSNNQHNSQPTKHDDNAITRHAEEAYTNNTSALNTYKPPHPQKQKTEVDRERRRRYKRKRDSVRRFDVKVFKFETPPSPSVADEAISTPPAESIGAEPKTKKSSSVKPHRDAQEIEDSVRDLFRL